MYTLVVVEILPMIYIALGLTLIGLFTDYKLFLLLAIGPITFLMFDYATVTDPHEGVTAIIVSLAGWILFNVYIALLGGTSNE